MLVFVLHGASVARAAGQPVVGYSTSLTSGSHRYVVHMDPRSTLIEDISTSGGTLAHAIPGRFAIPMVALDGSTGGLSQDGRTLVLTRPRSSYLPARSSEFAVLNADGLNPLRFVRLRGDFSFDAISPDGRWVYLIQFTGSSALQYRVRALDTHTGRLLGREIIDPHDRGEKMQGYPLSRVSSATGRWAYTLYDGVGRPFVHALDTAGLEARCIDLPRFPGAVQPFAVRLRLSGHVLSIVSGRRVLSAIDTRSLRPIDPSVGSSRAATTGSTVAAILAAVLAGLAAIVAVGAALVRRRSRQRTYQTSR